MKNIYIKTKGFIGDILFASSIAKSLKEERKDIAELIFCINLQQPMELLLLNPYIDDVLLNNVPKDSNGEYFYLKEIDQSIPATIQFQQTCGIKNPVLSYNISTNPHYDKLAALYMYELRQKYPNRKIIAVQENWEEKSFLFTKEEYKRGINHPPDLGYSGKRRDIKKIVHSLAEQHIVVTVGFPNGVKQNEVGLFSCPIFSFTASLIKMSDWMVGAEGGLTNLAAGVGTKTIITGDFIAQLYGPNGCIKKIENPMMGPVVYFPNAGHSLLNPFLTDEEVVTSINTIILTNIPMRYDWKSI